MLASLITSRTRIKMLVRFFLDSSHSGYLRGLASEFGESTNSIRIELNRLEEAGLLNAQNKGGKKIFRANTAHPLFPDIQSIIRKYTGIDEIIEQVIRKLGEPKALYLLGDIAKGIDSPDLGILIVGNNIDLDYLEILIGKAQRTISRTIRYVVFTPEEFNIHKPFLKKDKLLQVWEREIEGD